MANTTLPTLNYTTPEEFVNYYYEQLKADLGVFDLQISKVGFIGFFMNLLGYTHFDVKQYYDSLFKEAFIGTSQTEESQYIHAATYGYVPTFATASRATGIIQFDMINWLPRRQQGVVRREVIMGYNNSFDNTSSSTKFFIEGFQFTIDAFYKFVEVEDNGSYYYYTDIITSDGMKMTIPSATSTISVPIYSTSQYVQKEISFVLKPYNFGSFQTYYFGIDTGYYLADLRVFVTTTDSTIEEEYSVKYTKYLEKGNSKSVFLRKITSTNYVLEFGSGIRGNWISGASIRLVIKSTRGTSGNLIDKTNTKIRVSGTILAFDYGYSTSGELISISPTLAVLQQPLIDFDYAEGGLDPLSGEDLRDAVVRFIQTRGNLISQQDFYNIARNYFNDFKFLFKKFNIYDNIFHLCRAFRDKNQLICYTLNHTEPVLNLTSTSNLEYVPTATAFAGGSLEDNTYGYFVVAVDEWGQSSPSAIAIATTSGTDNSVKIDWDSVPYATKYRVYGRNLAFKNQYWEVDAPTVTYIDDGTPGVPVVVEPTSYILQELYYRPMFTINDEIFISPFIYKGNTRMNYYDGYILKDLSRIDFVGVTSDISTLGTGFDIPVVYLNLNYDDVARKTTVKLKSYQTISNLVFTISIRGPNLNIINQRMECFPLSNNEFIYEYDNANTFGLFEDEIQIEVKGGVSNSVLTANCSTFNTVDANILRIKVNDAPPYSNDFTVVTISSGDAVTAETLVSEINMQLGRTVASLYVDDYGNKRVRFTPPVLTGGETVQNIFIGSTGSTCLTALGLTGDDTSPAVLNGPLTTVKFTYITDKFYQLIDISDQLRLVRYQSGSDTYLVNIPVMYYNTFITDPDYYFDKFKNFISAVVFTENRMVTDNVQCRFLNSYYIESPFIESIFLQSGKIFSEAFYNYLDPVIDTRNTPPLNSQIGQKFRVGTVGIDAFAGHDNEIATYNGTGWDFYTPVFLPGLQQDFVLDNATNIYYRWSGDAWISLPVIKLPFRLRAEIKCDKTYVQKNNIDLATEKESLTLALAEYLQKSFSGSTVVFYNSLIDEFVHTGRMYIKSVKFYITDSSTIPNKLDNGIEVLNDTYILSNLKNKLDIVKYSPIMVHWDIDNLDIVMNIE